MSTPPNLVALGFTKKIHLEDYVLGMMLIGNRKDRAAAHAHLGATNFTGPFRAALFDVMRETDAAGSDFVWPDLWHAACARSRCRVDAAAFSKLADDVATAAVLPIYARRLRDLSLEFEADTLHRKALEEGDADGSLAERLTAIAGLRSELRDARCNG